MCEGKLYNLSWNLPQLTIDVSSLLSIWKQLPSDNLGNVLAPKHTISFNLGEAGPFHLGRRCRFSLVFSGLCSWSNSWIRMQLILWLWDVFCLNLEDSAGISTPKSITHMLFVFSLRLWWILCRPTHSGKRNILDCISSFTEQIKYRSVGIG